mgnify:CR=1 FL=1
MKTREKEVTVSEWIGEGKDAHRLVRVDARELTVFREYGDDEPRMLDADVAKVLKFKQPRMIRKLIERIWPENQRPHVRSTVERTSMPRGGARETTINTYWLTEAQILKVCARSETKVAEAVLDDMIATYIAARRGLLGRLDASAEMLRNLMTLTRENALAIQALQGMVGANVAAIEVLQGTVGELVGTFRQTVARVDTLEVSLDALRTRVDVVEARPVASATPDPRVAEMQERLAKLEARLASGVIGPVAALDHIVAPLRVLCSTSPGELHKRIHARFSKKLRNDLNFNMRGSTWANLPHESLADAILLIERYRPEIAAELAEAARVRAARDKKQPNLPFNSN